MKATAENRSVVFLGGAVFLFALLMRMVYFFQLKASPFFYYVGNQLDPQVYFEWAGRIAAGDWIGQGVFVGMPLYAYFLGILFIIFGKNIAAVIFLQLFLSALNCLLVFLIAKRLFSDKVACVAGIIASCYLPFLYNDAMLTSTVIVTSLNYAVLYLLLVFEKRVSVRFIAAAGAVLGLATLARANTFLFLPCVIFWLVFAFRQIALSKRLVFVLALTLCMFLFILPVTLRNYFVTGEKILVSPYGGVNFYIGNNPEASGLFSVPNGFRSDSVGLLEDFHSLAEKISGKKLTFTQASNYWFANTLRLIGIYPLRYVRLVFKKLFYFFGGFEIPDVMDYYFLKRYCGILNLPLFSFVLIGPLGLAGLFVTFQRIRPLFILYSFLASYVISILLVFVNARYRITIVPLLIIFASLGMVKMFDQWKEGGRKTLKRYFLYFCSFFIIVNAVPGEVNEAMCYNNLGLAFKEQGNLHESEKAFLKAIKFDPELAMAYNNLGIIYLQQNDNTRARAFFEQALAKRPGDPVYLTNLKLAGADNHALTIQVPNSANFHLNQGTSYLSQNRLSEAEEEYRKALDLDPDSIAAHYNMGIIYLKRKAFDLAKREWETCLKIGPQFTPAQEALKFFAERDNEQRVNFAPE
jgi:tetratricopeptide (TPR) repeat protein